MVRAYLWWHLAVAHRNEAGQNNKDSAEGMITRDQMAESQRLTREWLEARIPVGN
jgi:hypothetical protein